MRDSNSHYPLGHFFGAFFFGFAFIFVCYTGLPIDFNADYLGVSVRSLDTVGLRKLIELTLNPLTPAWFYPPDRQMEYMRPIQLLMFQIFHGLAPYSLVPFQIAAAVGHGLLAALFFGIVFYWTKSKLYGWLAVFLYASFPSNFFLMSSIGSFDFQYYVSVLNISALILFFLLTSSKLKSKLSFLLVSACWIAAIWIVIKLKSSEKILPFVCLGFLALRARSVLGQIGAWRFSLLIGCILAMMLLVFPLKPFEAWIDKSSQPVSAVTASSPGTSLTKKDNQTLSFNWTNALKRTFFMPGGDFPFTSPSRDKMPISFTENLGFFLAWPFWIGLLLTPFLLARQRQNTAYTNFFWLISIWFASIIAGFSSGAHLLDLRFLNFAYPPGVLLLFLMIYGAELPLFPAPSKKFFWRAGVALLVCVTLAGNFLYLIKLIGHFGGIQNAVVRAENDVFRAFYGRPPQEAELYERHVELEKSAVAIDWYNLPANWMEEVSQKLGKEKQIYFYTRAADSDRLKQLQAAGYRATLWKQYDFLDASPPIFRFFRVLNDLRPLFGRPAKKNEILVYKIEKEINEPAGQGNRILISDRSNR